MFFVFRCWEIKDRHPGTYIIVTDSELEIRMRSKNGMYGAYGLPILRNF